MPFFFWALIYFLISDEKDKITDPKFIFIIFYAGGPGPHLWFLPALGISLTMLYALKSQSKNILLALGIGLFTFSLVFGAYSDFYGFGNFETFSRNGPFVGFLFCLLGYLLALEKYKPNMITAIAITLSGIILQFLEITFIYNSTGIAHSHDFYIGTILYAVGVFFISLNIQPSSLVSKIAKYGPITLGMYCIHIIFLKSLAFLDIYLLKAIIITFASFISALVLSKIPYIRKTVI